MSTRVDRIEVRRDASAYLPPAANALRFRCVLVYNNGNRCELARGTFNACWTRAVDTAIRAGCCAYAVDANGNAFESYGEGGNGEPQA